MATSELSDGMFVTDANLSSVLSVRPYRVPESLEMHGGGKDCLLV